MRTRYYYADGRPMVDKGQCITPGAHVDKFTISVASLNGVSAEQIKALIEGRHEVKTITHTDRNITVLEHRKA